MHRRESMQYMGSSSVTRNTTGSLRRLPIKSACPLLNGLSREPGWDAGSGPEEDQNGAGIPVGGREAMTVIGGQMVVLAAAVAVAPLGMCGEVRSHQGLVTARVR